ncbi:mandelate racemase/muconate lactonizing enzyme family protein [Saccharopolyspora sp. ASAGF58]|uniref:mandelate racemase/muconate lactonizing enzyme family protein n=1 Tax=Saccharopolyspora sp. ASAGF58 TaxID=2719023 RepID=UPI00143FF036|nr:mandelate racemase/muconate lactonizing enzyme family protein [Saccharopolyspora sp. ASAGF58]QIZ37616.1 mandelate racemase/muconate lactonizing enzyme family protein [Saccharopolyspora sp. ASAGF58]
MKIIEVETIRPQIQSNLVFVRLRTDEGLTGLGEAFFGPKAVEAYIHESAAPILFSMDNANPEHVMMALRPYVGYQGSGAETRGNAAIDLALWDILGKSTGRPLAELFGGPVRDSIRCYNTCGGTQYMTTLTEMSSKNWGLPADATKPNDLEDLDAFLHRPGQLAKDLVAEGFTGMKIWPFDQAAEASNGNDISSDELKAGIKVLSDIREAVGDKIDIMVEMHGLWRRPAATRILKGIAEFQPLWVEDPLRPDAIDALVRLRQSVDMPIAIGETSVGRRGFQPLLAAGIVDYATVDIQWTGGIGEARKIAALADAFAVPLAPHDCTGPVSLAASTHLVMSEMNGFIQEVSRAYLRTWYPQLVTGVPQVVNGILSVPEGPGHGVELREDIDSVGVERQLTKR